MSVVSKADVRTQIDLLLESDLSDRPGFLGERVLGLPGDVRVDKDAAWKDVARN